jgi:hypothetical protein
MAIRHNLALDIPETANPNALIIRDASIYGAGLPVECIRLDITLPGFTVPLYITEDLTPGFQENFGAKELGLQDQDETTLLRLPDGVYKIRFSVAPNDKVYVEYYHLRTTHILNKYYKLLCKINLEACEPEPSQREKLQKLREIKMYIEAAKAKTEHCHSPEKGIQLLTYADSLLSKFEKGCCKNC